MCIIYLYINRLRYSYNQLPSASSATALTNASLGLRIHQVGIQNPPSWGPKSRKIGLGRSLEGPKIKDNRSLGVWSFPLGFFVISVRLLIIVVNFCCHFRSIFDDFRWMFNHSVTFLIIFARFWSCLLDFWQFPLDF